MADRIVDPATQVSIREMGGRDGRDGAQSDSINRVWHCWDNPDPMVCRQALLNQAVAIDLYEFENLTLEFLEWSLLSGATKWRFAGSYTTAPPIAGYTIHMDTTGGQSTITEAFAQTGFPATGFTAPDFGKSINVQGAGDVRGAQRVDGAFKFNVRAKMAKTWVADAIAYAKEVYTVTGYMNNATYLTFNQGELLFLGGSGEIVGENPILSYSFLAHPNRVNFTVGDITGINAWGHDELWTRYYSTTDPVTKWRIEKALAVYASQKYLFQDFSKLKIGEPDPP